MMKPPFTTLTNYDLNKGTIAWQVGLGDHARLAALGVTGTGAPQWRGSLIVTAGGLVFAPGGDARCEPSMPTAGRSCGRAQLGAAIRGAPAMYEIDGRAVSAGSGVRHRA